MAGAGGVFLETHGAQTPEIRHRSASCDEPHQFPRSFLVLASITTPATNGTEMLRRAVEMIASKGFETAWVPPHLRYDV